MRSCFISLDVEMSAAENCVLVCGGSSKVERGEDCDKDEDGERAESREVFVAVEFDLSTLGWLSSLSRSGKMSVIIPLSENRRQQMKQARMHWY